jgi:hypothetical protein
MPSTTVCVCIRIIGLLISLLLHRHIERLLPRQKDK